MHFARIASSGCAGFGAVEHQQDRQAAEKPPIRCEDTEPVGDRRVENCHAEANRQTTRGETPVVPGYAVPRNLVGTNSSVIATAPVWR